MLSRMNKRSKTRSEAGFTLIELLVVIIIIGILAAIAIPMYLQQRKKGWHASAESDARNAAVAMESYYTGVGDGAYTGATEVLLKAEGFVPSANAAALVILIKNGAGGEVDQAYEITSSDTRDAGCTYKYDSLVGYPVGAGC